MDAIVGDRRLLATCAASLVFGMFLGMFFERRRSGTRRSTQYLDVPDGEMKLVLGVRTDLKMGKGKVAAQCGHATLAAYHEAVETAPAVLEAWEHSGQPKIVVKVPDAASMAELYRAARRERLCVNIIQDAGRTQIPRGSQTVIAIGPGPKDAVDRVSGHLKLY